MSYLTKKQERQMRANGRWNARKGQADDFRPVVKLYCPWSGATWLLTALDPADPDLAYGLCDLGLGYAELGQVRLSEIAAVEGPNGQVIERDARFRATKSLNAYASGANDP